MLSDVKKHQIRVNILIKVLKYSKLPAHSDSAVDKIEFSIINYSKGRNVPHRNMNQHA